MSESIPLIPTRYRSQIGQTLSWSIGAEALSLALSGIPQYSELDVTFSPYGWATAELPDIRILGFRYRKNSRGLSASNSPDKAQKQLQRHWEISVYPVPRAIRHLIKTQLIENLPLAKDWLQKRGEMNEIGKDELTFIFNTQDELFKLVEASNMSPVLVSRKR